MSYSDLYLTESPYIMNPGGTSKKKQSPNEKHDAVVFGVPFDSTHSFRPGTRFGPDSIREMFNNVEIFSDNFKVDLENADIEDLGNLRHTVVAGQMLEMAKKVTSELLGGFVVVLGGEHSLTYATYSQYPENTGFLVFDAHYDLRDEYADTKDSHAAYLRRIAEERGTDSIIHVGARAYAKEEIDFLKSSKINTVSDKDIREAKHVDSLRDLVSSFDNLYVSFDLDVLDPAFGPGVGNPEAGGITSRELLDMVRVLEGKKVDCCDIVELCPPYDNGATASIAAKVMCEMVAMNLKRSKDTS